MIVADTSALIAVLRREAEADLFESVLSSGDLVLIGTPTRYEFFMVAVGSRPGADNGARELLEQFRIHEIHWTTKHAELAIQAFLLFGKGRHPAKLNFGDCMTYAVANSLDAPLLFKGLDFSRTDLKAAI